MLKKKFFQRGAGGQGRWSIFKPLILSIKLPPFTTIPAAQRHLVKKFPSGYSFSSSISYPFPPENLRFDLAHSLITNILLQKMSLEIGNEIFVKVWTRFLFKVLSAANSAAQLFHFRPTGVCCIFIIATTIVSLSNININNSSLVSLVSLGALCSQPSQPSLVHLFHTYRNVPPSCPALHWYCWNVLAWMLGHCGGGNSKNGKSVCLLPGSLSAH